MTNDIKTIKALAITPMRILTDTSLTANEKLLAGLIFGDFALKGGFELTDEELARILNVPAKSVAPMLEKLSHKELIKAKWWRADV
ncbi:MAG: hypothetical protein LBQ52_01900 [Helicobacteraceae bacterium]|jgi:transcription initiation factor IIE alpha subunit|nr:hypothetical protein [Helicobacteraceae bacterium]